MHIKKNLLKKCPLTVGGGGKALADSDAKNVFFFYMLHFKSVEGGGSGSVTSFTAPKEGLLQPNMVYCILTWFTEASLRFTEPHKVDCTNSKRFYRSFNN